MFQGQAILRTKTVTKSIIFIIFRLFFKRCKTRSFLKIVQQVPVILPSKVFVERVFSIMQNIWTNEISLKFEIVKAELLEHLNCNIKCTEFANFMKSDIGK
jgi:hypothetical protein